jgi:TatD DNase family protein
VIDSHCHLDFPQFDEDRAAILARATAAGVSTIMAVGIGSGSPKPDAGLSMCDLASPRLQIFATTGIHPNSAAEATPELLAEVERLSHDARILAIGEIGMDFHYDTPRDVQERVFITQMEIARAAKKPIVIHTRDAWQATIPLLRDHWIATGLGGIMHCFSGDLAMARVCLDMGFLLSFAGPLTFPKATELRDVAAQVPLDRVLIETDAPYLAPVPYRGKRNEPAYVAEVCKKMAEIRRVSVEEMDAQTTVNFHNLLIH